MEVALAISFGLIVVAPFLGRWRASVWLQANVPESTAVPASNVAETA